MVSSVYGTPSSSIRPYRTPSLGAARPRQPSPSPSAPRHFVGRRAWLQRAWGTGTIGHLAPHRHLADPVGENRRACPGLRACAPRTERAHQACGHGERQLHRQGPSGRTGGAQNNGIQSLGHSRGGWPTKMQMGAAAARPTIGCSLSLGHAPDAPEGRTWLHRLGPHPARPSLLMARS